MLTVEQVAKKLGVSKMSIYRWIASKELKAFRITRKTIRIKEEDLQIFLNKKRIK